MSMNICSSLDWFSLYLSYATTPNFRSVIYTFTNGRTKQNYSWIVEQNSMNVLTFFLCPLVLSYLNPTKCIEDRSASLTRMSCLKCLWFLLKQIDWQQLFTGHAAFIGYLFRLSLQVLQSSTRVNATVETRSVFETHKVHLSIQAHDNWRKRETDLAEKHSYVISRESHDHTHIPYHPH